MYTLEYIMSKGRASEHLYHRDIVDFYFIHKNGKRIYSEKQDWSDYCLALEIDNLNKRIYVKKMFFILDRISCYDCRISDYWSIRDELDNYINNVQTLLDIRDYEKYILE